ncbi:glycoside hydrolase family 15 protein [Streptomyces sp. NPDC057939]|uniref:glycoside hydrolase family 15 protein n=1 Tax=Streptomyces sp. NPDC057939 TaxID=3346284 RepID=UPI0036E54EC2
MNDRPIADYALLSDCHTGALVSRHGSVDWLCMPDFDSPSVLGRILGPRAGHWLIRATGPSHQSRRYLERTMVLETTFSTPTGTLTVTDALATGRSESGHDLGLHAPHLLVRVVRCTEGRVAFETEFAPRPEYGLNSPRLVPVEGGLHCLGGPDTLTLCSPYPLETTDAARCSSELREGQYAGFAFQHVPADGQPTMWSQDEILTHLQDTVDAWRAWSGQHQTYEGPWAELVHHSGRVLQSLSFQPTGAIVAAPTTSLPEETGGVRNWDYRYAWVRDASFTLDALWVAACPYEAEEFFRWLARAAAGDPEHRPDLQIMFGIRGERDLSERELPHLPGWRDSRPVRIGNGAWAQRQLDVYGELLAAFHKLRHHLHDADDSTRAFLAGLADTAAVRWREKDQGIWEVRSEPQHFLYSKLMCWVAVDRALDLVDELGAQERVPVWRRARDEIRAAIEQDGWSPSAGAYTQAFGSDILDASALMIAIVGFEAADTPRMRATIEAVEARLTGPDGMVYRYLTADDGLPGGEGNFLLCTCWLAQALALAGDVEGARTVFERVAGCMNDVGLLAEEVDPVSGELLGNFPQAFSHIGLINAAWAIHQAELRTG